MKMNEVEVCVMDGEIVIIQDNIKTGIENSITLSADQASIFCKWVKGAAKAIDPTNG